MRQSISPKSWMLAVCVGALAVAPARAYDDAAATRSVTVQKAGVRGGKPGEIYLNVEGRHNGEGGKYASFGVLEFPAPKIAGDGSKGGTLALTLVQSVARFSKDGKVKFYLATGPFKAKIRSSTWAASTASAGPGEVEKPARHRRVQEAGDGACRHVLARPQRGRNLLPGRPPGQGRDHPPDHRPRR